MNGCADSRILGRSCQRGKSPRAVLCRALLCCARTVLRRSCLVAAMWIDLGSFCLAGERGMLSVDMVDGLLGGRRVRTKGGTLLLTNTLGYAETMVWCRSRGDLNRGVGLGRRTYVVVSVQETPHPCEICRLQDHPMDKRIELVITAARDERSASSARLLGFDGGLGLAGATR